ncbi:MAG: gliding motility-associated C-terminal domain-containing protein [Chitinophagaceae bacterium]
MDTRIQFCLAKKDPDGGNTTGITRTKSFFEDFDVDIEDGRMKNLVQWDPTRYVNIWYVTGLKSELMPMFSCGVWSRMHEGGYATMPPGGGETDGIVVTGFGTLLAHEMGHYLGLYHTFEGLNCANNDCSTQGDRVCDTPPDRAIGNSVACDQPDNSCNSDTLSGFATDVPDMISNFMDYGNDACHKSFTEGQAARMRAAIATQRSSLLLQNQCDQPCAENIIAAFTRDNAYPLPNDVINFTNSSTGASNYEWQVDNTVIATTANFSYSFPASGKYKVTLKAYNADANCYAMYTDYIIVNCGVTARFYPDKRLIASKANIYLDSIYFTNRSVNSTSYKWLMGNDQGMAEQVISTSTDLNYVFQQPGHYTVRLIATNGSCTDTTETFSFNVEDPTADADIHLNSVDCYQQNKIRITLYICNNGYASLPAGTPVTFYDSDPRNGNANVLGTFNLPDEVKGKCCGYQYTYIVDANKPGVNTFYAVVNDNGSTMPLQLPNTTIPEKNYNNNIGFRTQFQFKVSVLPATATLEPGDSLQLTSAAGPGNATYSWTPVQNMSCTDCANPVLVATKDTLVKLIGTSQYGCVDSGFSVVKVPPADDHTINVNSIDCAAGNKFHVSFTLCNSFHRGKIPKGLKVSFYDADPATSAAHLLTPVFVTPADSNQLCASFEHLFTQTATGKIFAVVNDNGTTIPVQLPNDPSFKEKNYTNNKNSITYQPSFVQLSPTDTTVIRKESFPMQVITNVTTPSNYQWQKGNGYLLNCTNCASPVITVMDSGTVHMQLSNTYGCIFSAQAKVKIFPPDMTLKILETNCYTDKTTLVKFRIDMNNGYDTIPQGLPVSFYDALPVTRGLKKLLPGFTVKEAVPSGSSIFTQVIESPSAENIYGVVNDRLDGADTPPNKVFDETDYGNNSSTKTIAPFAVKIVPGDTSVPRSSNLQLSGQVSGGNASMTLWEPGDGLSCTHCLNPVAKVTASVQYTVTVQNDYSCIAKDVITIKTFTSGKVDIPSAFTPNNDGLNDVFYIMGGKEVKQVNNLAVFNRWGQKIFESTNSPANDRNYGWKGMFKGSPVDGGVYVYLATVEFLDGTKEVYKGTITLIR